jgi:hypothetical protein
MSDYSIEFGYGVYVDKFSKLKDGSDTFEEIEFNAEDYVVVDDDDIASLAVFRINRKHEYQRVDVDGGLVLMATDISARIFGDTKRTFDDIIEHMRGSFGQYLPDDFDYENNLVEYEFIRL